MQQPRLRRETTLNNTLQITRLVVLDIRLGESITGARHQSRSVDNQGTQTLDALPEDGESLRRGPDIRRRVLRQIGESVCRGVLQRWVLAEGAVDVVGALEGVEVA